MMDETTSLLLESFDKVLHDHCSAESLHACAQGGFDAGLWSVIEELGFNTAALGEDKGGAGLRTSGLIALLRIAGRHCAPVPMAEALLLGPCLCAESGLELPPGPVAVGPVIPEEELAISPAGTGWRLSGTLRRLAWPDKASRLLVMCRSDDVYQLAAVNPADCTVKTAVNLAGETRATVVFDSVSLTAVDVAPVRPGFTPDRLLELGALARASLMVGALDAAMEQTLKYTLERKQFGRPIAKFQAVQHQMAQLACELAAAAAMVNQAAVLMERGAATEAVAAAKIRAGQAAGVGASIAHQLHGAIGFTEEFPLQHVTRRLWAWRDEYGSERYWSFKLGSAVADLGADAVWPLITQAPRNAKVQDQRNT